MKAMKVMKAINIMIVLASITLLSACGGGGGGGGSSTPPAPEPTPPQPGSIADDTVTLEEDNTVSIDVLANDTNVSASSLAVQTSPSNGTASVSSGRISYTPASDFVGEDSLVYSVNGDDGVSLSATVSITVTAITVTSMEFRTLSLPSASYASSNDPELDATILASPIQELIVPPNTISVLLNLSGPGVGLDGNNLFISSMAPPSGPYAAFQHFVNHCAEGLCSSLVPRSPEFIAEPGVWTYRLGTKASSLDNIDFGQLSLTAVIRTGPAPDKSLARPAAVSIRPFLTATSLSVADIDSVMARYQAIADQNRIEAVIEPVTVIDDPQYSEVSSDFLDATTAALVSQGGADSINLFFIEDFTDTKGLIGRSGGIPGKPGSNNGFNGSLLDVALLRDGPDEFFFRNAAEIAFHESGHLLGLYHTTEGDFSEVDVLGDTPFCEQTVHDADGNGFAAVAECPDGLNPMFWTTDLNVEKTLLTEDQQHVIIYSPIAVPGS